MSAEPCTPQPPYALVALSLSLAFSRSHRISLPDTHSAIVLFAVAPPRSRSAPARSSPTRRAAGAAAWSSRAPARPACSQRATWQRPTPPHPSHRRRLRGARCSAWGCPASRAAPSAASIASLPTKCARACVARASACAAVCSLRWRLRSASTYSPWARCLWRSCTPRSSCETPWCCTAGQPASRSYSTTRTSWRCCSSSTLSGRARRRRSWPCLPWTPPRPNGPAPSASSALRPPPRRRRPSTTATSWSCASSYRCFYSAA